MHYPVKRKRFLTNNMVDSALFTGITRKIQGRKLFLIKNVHYIRGVVI